jgi:hypothetical protein
MESDEKRCALCGKLIDPSEAGSPFVNAGEWLAEDVWNDSGELCNLCLENRGRLAMMYLHDKNR